MKEKIKKLSLIRKIFLTMILSVTLLILILSGLEIFHSYHNYRQEIDLLQSESLAKQKDLIKIEVERVIFYIQGLVKFNEQLAPDLKMPMPELKNYIISQLIDLRYRNDGYFFGSARNGEPLFSNGKITIGSRNVWDLTDPNGVKIIQKQHEAFDSTAGVYTKYSWQKLNQLTLSPKISYSHAVPELDWIIGTGVYLEDINNQLAYSQKLLRQALQTKILSYLLILSAYFLICFFIIKHFSANIKKNINSFSQFFVNASDNYQNIDLKELHYPEFKQIATAANKMIDKRKISEEALKISEMKYKLLINTTSEGFWMIDAERITIEVNNSLCQMLGFSRPEIIGKTPQDFLDSENYQILLDNFQELQKLPHQSFEVFINTKSGEKLPCLIKSTKLVDDNHQFYAIFAFITDITDRKNYEKKLHDYQNHLEELIKERTLDLETKNEELKNFNKLFIGREFRIKELRDKVKTLEEKLNPY
ncbi:MAG: cache domain-containing protein [Candidatus Cloacimonetes bacterium]|nr:cache domain-containing protein [Candidatus Cloacimonadota bacterium]